jgi:hypothetical protein
MPLRRLLAARSLGLASSLFGKQAASCCVEPIGPIVAGNGFAVKLERLIQFSVWQMIGAVIYSIYGTQICHCRFEAWP